MSVIRFDVNSYNAVINNWKNNTRRRAKGNVLRMTKSEIPSPKPLAQNLGSVARKDSGEIFMVGFQFPRHGVFVHKGVGRGYPMQGGKVVRTAKGVQTAVRKEKDWLNSEIEKGLPDLADKIVELKADAAVVATRAKIN